MSCPPERQLFEQLERGEGPALDHAATCPRCQALLFPPDGLDAPLRTLRDPSPPPELLPAVMARVAREREAPRGEAAAGLGILLGSALAALAAFALHPASASQAAVRVGALWVELARFASALAAAAVALLETTPVPVAGWALAVSLALAVAVRLSLPRRALR